MKEIANATTESGSMIRAEGGQISVIDGLAMQARALRLSINVNMWQLARVFIEARELVPHGEWGAWLKENADVSERTAQDMMAAYRRFGGRAAFEGLSPTQSFKLLPLPEGAEERFMAEHDVRNMSTREIQEAVKKAREEERAKVREENEEALRQVIAGKDSEILHQVAHRDEQIAAQKAQIEAMKTETEEMRRRAEEAESRAQDATRAAIEGAREASTQNSQLEAEARRLTGENAGLRKELQEQEELLQEQQEALNRAQEELLNLQSAQARGGDPVHTDELTIDVFESAVREFIGICARMPHMGATFAAMDNPTLNRYFQLVKTVESWAEGARSAITTVKAEGGIIIE